MNMEQKDKKPHAAALLCRRVHPGSRVRAQKSDRLTPAASAGRGFSLVELLAVMAVISVLASLAAPAISSLSKGSQMNQALAEVGGLLEEARQYAVAKNTYVWVAFNDSPSGADDQLRVAVLASKSGADLVSWGTDDTTSSLARTELLNRVRTFKQVKLSGAGAFDPSKIPDLPTVSNPGDPGSANFTIRVPGGNSERFAKAIQFTPGGEARKTSALIGMIEIGLQPTHGQAADADNVAVVRVNGLTGQSAIYRP